VARSDPRRVGVRLLQVHWKGSSAAEDEWFPREDLLLEFPDAVREFEQRRV
jgi:hypothetical protein